MQNNPKSKRKTPLRASMALLILGCWVLPILLIVGVSGVLSARANSAHVGEIAQSSVDSAIHSVRRDLDAVVDDALGASYIPTVRLAYTQLLRGGDTKVFYDEVYDFLQFQYGHNTALTSAHLLFADEELTGNTLYFAYNRNKADYNHIASFYEGGVPGQVRDGMQAMGTEIDFIYEDGNLYLVRVLSLHDNRFANYAALVLEIDTGLLFQSLHGLPWVTGANLYIGAATAPLYENDLGAVYADMLASGEHSRREGGALLMAGDAHGERYTLSFCVEAQLTGLGGGGNATATTLLLLALLSIPLLLIVYLFFRRKISTPLYTMESLAYRIENGEFGAQMERAQFTSREMDNLAMCMNEMSAKLEDQFERNYRGELALRDAQMEALQGQINPHFLGNTLEIINWEARLGNSVKVSRMLEALSTMLEAALDRKRQPLIHLSEEMVYVNSYLYIIKERLGKRLEVRTELDGALMDCYVPRLILQPILENAVEHGLAGAAHGVITLRAVQEDAQWMRLEVENDRPMSEADAQRAAQLLAENSQNTPGETSVNIGIRNVHKRLRILYGGQGGLRIQNRDGHTVCSMTLQRQDSLAPEGN